MIYNPHPLASIFPLMAASEYVALKEDIKTHGLREPIWILDGQILDGRNRFKACQEVGVTPRVQEYHGDDPLALVISLNLQRRHLSESQRAMVAAKLANMPRGGDGSNQHGSKSANLQISATPVDAGFEVANAGVANLHLRIPGISQVEAASLLNVSPRSVATAKKVEEQAEPELVEAVASGQVSVSAAAVITELPPETQHYAAANPQEAPAIAANHRALGTGENEWYTPEKYLQAVRAVLGGIDLDPASCPLANETVKAARIFTVRDDGLKQPWSGRVFMNPHPCGCGINIDVITWTHENKTMPDVRRPDERNGEAMPDLHENDAAAYQENLHEMLAGITEHARSFCGERGQGEVVFRLLQRMRAGICEDQASTTKGRPSGKGKTTGGVAQIQTKRERHSCETSALQNGQSHQEDAQDERVLPVEQISLGEVPARMGSPVRVLWEGGSNDAGSLYSAITSGLSWDGPWEHSSCVLAVQPIEGAAASDGLGWTASICKDCGKIGISVIRKLSLFVNPPYSQPAMANFAERLASEWRAGNLESAIALTHNYTDTAWFQRLARACSAICFTRGRIGFINPEGKKAAPTQGQAFFYFGDDSGWFATHFDPIGFIVEVRDGLS